MSGHFLGISRKIVDDEPKSVPSLNGCNGYIIEAMLDTSAEFAVRLTKFHENKVPND